eukprot:g35935.t1
MILLLSLGLSALRLTLAEVCVLPMCTAPGCVYVHFFWAAKGDLSEKYQAAATDLPIVLKDNIDLDKHKLVYWYTDTANFDFAAKLGRDFTVCPISEPLDILPSWSDLARTKIYETKSKKYWDRFLEDYKKFATIKDWAMMMILYAYGGYFVDTTAGPVLAHECYAPDGQVCDVSCRLVDELKGYYVYRDGLPSEKGQAEGTVDWKTTTEKWPCTSSSEGVNCEQCHIRQIPLATKMQLLRHDEEFLLVRNDGSWNLCETKDYSPRGTVKIGASAVPTCKGGADPKTVLQSDFYFAWAKTAQSSIAADIADSFLRRLRQLKASVKLEDVFPKLATAEPKFSSNLLALSLRKALDGSYKQSKPGSYVFDDREQKQISKCVEQILPSVTASAVFDGLENRGGSVYNFRNQIRFDGAGPNPRGWNTNCIPAQNNIRALCKRMTGGWRGLTANLEVDADATAPIVVSGSGSNLLDATAPIIDVASGSGSGSDPTTAQHLLEPTAPIINVASGSGSDQLDPTSAQQLLAQLSKGVPLEEHENQMGYGEQRLSSGVRLEEHEMGSSEQR